MGLDSFTQRLLADSITDVMFYRLHLDGTIVQLKKQQKKKAA
jgi:hypothetical protein